MHQKSAPVRFHRGFEVRDGAFRRAFEYCEIQLVLTREVVIERGLRESESVRDVSHRDAIKPP
jgi:hypothetical protein